MSIAQSMLPEYDQEVATTHRVLERLPEDAFGWRPHEKSWTLGELGSHVANLMGWCGFTLSSTELDVNPPGGEPLVSPRYDDPETLLAAFDQNAAAGRAALAAASDADLMVPWSLKNGGETIFSMPRIATLRAFVLNHLIHHRGQLSVYLRLRDVPVPSIYGPSADEAL